MKVQFKKLIPEAKIPTYAKEGDGALDITATSYTFDQTINAFVYKTGLAIKIPEGHVGLLFPRSSICKKDMMLSNHVGIVDSGYTGEIKFVFKTTIDEVYSSIYQVGDRIGQLLIIPYQNIELEEVNELPITARAQSGYGSSGQ